MMHGLDEHMSRIWRRAVRHGPQRPAQVAAGLLPLALPMGGRGGEQVEDQSLPGRVSVGPRRYLGMHVSDVPIS